MDVRKKRKDPDSRIADGILGILILIVAGVSFYRRERGLVSTIPLTEEWEDWLGI